ncbi:hypothetical protein G5V59_09245 [Nocardioides sp. W3-2-3]|nr:hypothetical protein [Nocardioides convexus]
MDASPASAASRVAAASRRSCRLAGPGRGVADDGRHQQRRQQHADHGDGEHEQPPPHGSGTTR